MIIPRQTCGGCTKQILGHNRNVICADCSKICHFRCASNLEYQLTKPPSNTSSAIWHCKDCAIRVNKNGPFISRYNPFIEYLQETDTRLDSVTCNDELHIASEVLETCEAFESIPELNAKILKSGDSGNAPPNLTILFNNIDGNKTNFDSFTVDLNRHNTKFSAIAICETNIDASHKNMYSIEGYESCYQSKLAGKAKGSGLGLYIDSMFAFDELPESSVCSPDLETIFIKITNTLEPVIIGAVYRPPSGNPVHFNQQFHSILELLPKSNVYIAGDFNLNLSSASQDTNTSNFQESFLSAGFYPTISLPTHEMPNCNATCIDNIFTNNPGSVTFSATIKESVSHHHPILCLCTSDQFSSTVGKELPPKTFWRYNFNQTNVAALLLETADMTNDLVLCSNFDGLLARFSDIIDKTCKEEISCNSKRNSIDNPWITPGIINSVNTKHDLYRSWQKTIKNKKDPEDHGDLDLQAKYLVHRNKLKYVIKHAKELHNLNKINEVEGDMKATWKLINHIRGKKTSKIAPAFFINGELVREKRVIAHSFNEYFVSIAKHLNDSTNGNILQEVPSFESFMFKRSYKSMVLEACTSDEIEEIVKLFSSSKASDIPVHAVKQCIMILSPILSVHFNYFMETGVFPDILKVGKITPVYKNKGRKQRFDSFRPISTLPIFGKIFEKIIYIRLYSFFLTQNFMYSKQFGFRQGHSTSHALNYSVNFLTNAIAKNKHIIGIFIDLSKAFDTIDHDKLLVKLDNYGVRGNCHSLLKSYLTNRKQYTSFDGENSSKADVIFGVPQGSVLGPLLFLIYVNDIVNCSPYGEFILYADDTNIFIVADSKAEAFKKANKVLELVNNYMVSNQLHINTSKCYFIYFRPKLYSRSICARTAPYDRDAKLFLTGTQVKQVSSIKFLGVTIDENLNWLPHIDNLKNKLVLSQGALYRIKDYIPKRLHKTLYHSLFESHLTYGISVWGSQSNSVMEKLFNIQKSCVRMLFGNQHALSKNDTYCYCKWGYSGIMLCCEKCNKWFHDECLGLSENDIDNIDAFYCAGCINLNKGLKTTYLNDPQMTNHCSICSGSVSEIMANCGSCTSSFHPTCINRDETEINNILLFFCENCTLGKEYPKIIYKDYTKEHTKPLFKKHEILTIHNLYPYYCLLELYKILKFRTPYSLYEIFRIIDGRSGNLSLAVPITALQCQRRTFFYQSTLLWNNYYKKLLTPSEAELHRDYTTTFDLTACKFVFFDFSTKVGSFKSRLKHLLFDLQCSGDEMSWHAELNYHIRT